MTLTDRDSSILTQVAFKETARFYDGSAESIPEFQTALSVLNDALHLEVARAGAEYVPQSPVSAPRPQQGFDAQASIEANLGGTEVGAHNVEVIQTKEGGQNGAFPAWFIADAAAAGVTRVFDNRHKLGDNPRLPWFKSPKDQGEVAFWPPKAGR